MNELLNRSVSIYRRLLFLYPEELRRDFGAEMVLAFAEDLEEAWGDARLAGVAQMWWYTLREIVTVALPSQQSNPCVIVPALSFVFTAAIESGFAWLGVHQGVHVGSEAIRWAILMPSFLNALVSLVVTCFYARCTINVLRLE